MTAVLLPGVAMFGWLATENGVEAVLGCVGLLVVTSKRAGWWTAPVLGGLAVGVYPSGIAWAAAIGAVALVRVVRSTRRWRDAGRVGAALVVAVLVVLFPLVWWRTGDRVVTGGGAALPLESIPANLADLWGLLTSDGRSYYYFSDQPGLGSPWLALATGPCRKPWTTWPRRCAPGSSPTRR